MALVSEIEAFKLKCKSNVCFEIFVYFATKVSSTQEIERNFVTPTSSCLSLTYDTVKFQSLLCLKFHNENWVRFNVDDISSWFVQRYFRA